MLNFVFFSSDAVDRLVDWLKEQYHMDSEANDSNYPEWLPQTNVPTLLYYEAPWCVFCSVLTPRIRLAARTLQRSIAFFRFHRITDVEQVTEPTEAGKAGNSSSNVYAVPHYPSLIFYPMGTL